MWLWSLGEGVPRVKHVEVICVEVRSEVRGMAPMNKAQGQSVPQAVPDSTVKGLPKQDLVRMPLVRKLISDWVSSLAIKDMASD